jgi:ribosomal protein S12 methylthiotransferase
MLYLYNAGITPRLLELVASERRILPYFDMPIQHGSDEVLARMRRPERNRTIRDKVARIREVVPDVAIRTTCIVGFPGETDRDFQTLMSLLEDVQFDRVGAFAYSPQEGTAAYRLSDDVPDSLKLERLERLTELQSAVTAERFETRIGRSVDAMVDRVHPGGIEARTIWQAHDIDGITRIGQETVGCAPGDLLQVRVDSVEDDVDLTASVERVVSRAGALPAPSRRALPLMTVGAYGR